MIKGTKKKNSVDLTVTATDIGIDLVRSSDGHSTATNPLTPLGIADELDSLADCIKNQLPSVAQRAEFCAWRLRDLIPAIGQPDGILITRDTAGRLHFPIAPGTFDLLELLGQARSICNRIRRPERIVDDKGNPPAEERLRNLAASIRTAAAKLENRGTNATELISFDEIALLAGVVKSTVQNRASTWRKTSAIPDPCNYAVIQPYLAEAWGSALFPTDYGLMRDILASRRSDQH